MTVLAIKPRAAGVFLYSIKWALLAFCRRSRESNCLWNRRKTTKISTVSPEPKLVGFDQHDSHFLAPSGRRQEPKLYLLHWKLFLGCPDAILIVFTACKRLQSRFTRCERRSFVSCYLRPIGVEKWLSWWSKPTVFAPGAIVEIQVVLRRFQRLLDAL